MANNYEVLSSGKGLWSMLGEGPRSQLRLRVDRRLITMSDELETHKKRSSLLGGIRIQYYSNFKGIAKTVPNS